MSYDLEIGVKVADADELYARVAVPEYRSPTYNLRKMFETCMDWKYSAHVWYPCAEVLPKVERGIRELRLKPDYYKQFNAPNGWGKVDGATRDLESLRTCIYETAEIIPIEYLYMRW